MSLVQKLRLNSLRQQSALLSDEELVQLKKERTELLRRHLQELLEQEERVQGGCPSGFPAIAPPSRSASITTRSPSITTPSPSRSPSITTRSPSITTPSPQVSRSASQLSRSASQLSRSPSLIISPPPIEEQSDSKSPVEERESKDEPDQMPPILRNTSGKKTVFVPLEKLIAWYNKGPTYLRSHNIKFHSGGPVSLTAAQNNLVKKNDRAFHQKFLVGGAKYYNEQGFEAEINKQLHHVYDLFMYLLTGQNETPLLKTIKSIFDTYGVKFLVGCIVNAEPYDPAARRVPKNNVDIYMPASKDAYDARMNGFNVALKVDYGPFTHTANKEQFIFKPASTELVTQVWKALYGAKLGVEPDTVPVNLKRVPNKSDKRCPITPGNSLTTTMDWAGKTHRKTTRAQACLKRTYNFEPTDSQYSLTQVMDALLGYVTPNRMAESAFNLKKIYDALQCNPARTVRGKLAMLQHVLALRFPNQNVGISKYIEVKENGAVCYTAAGRALVGNTMEEESSDEDDDEEEVVRPTGRARKK